jgi:3,4-dihydroxyphenylacetate 2,3-dioxygenase
MGSPMVRPMGEVAAAGVIAHQPLVMLPRSLRIRLGETGRDTTLVEPGYRLVREHLAERGVDTLVIVDTHWFTTSEHVVAGADHFRGRYTSEEMPRVIDDVPYDFPGAPDLAREVARVGRERGLPVVNATSASLPRHYPTINLVHHLRTDERVLSVGVLQTGAPRHFLAFGRALAVAAGRTDHRVAVLGSGGMSHTFWPVDQQRGKVAFDPRHVISEAARDWDARMLAHWAAGEHGKVVDLYPEYRTVHPEGLFGHYLTVLGAIGGPGCRAPGRQLSDYENALGTGQVHVVFDLDEASVEGPVEASDGRAEGSTS